MSISLFEHLSNELFFEICEYFDGCEIYKLFSNLNNHFQELINSLLLLLKFDSHCLTSNGQIYKQLLLNNKHQIFSFYITQNEFFLSFSIDSSFKNLESLIIIGIPEKILYSLLANLSSLPRLFSLTIDTQYTLDDFSDVYRLAFTLPKLKYIKCTAGVYTLCDLLPMATDEQFSSIEYLSINHSCTFNELCTLISYLPELHRLTFLGPNDDDDDSSIEVIQSMELSNLTYLNIDIDKIPFDNL